MDLDSQFPDLPTLETERLILRKLTLEDAPAIFGYARDPEVARYVGWDAHQTIEDSLAFVRLSIEAYEQHREAPWGMLLKAGQQLIGTCGIFDWRPAHRKAEIGYAIGRGYWGQGYTPEAVRAMLKFGFEEMSLNRIQAMCDVPNVASARVMEKSGMSFEGVLRQFMYSKGEFVDLKLYSILRSEWEMRSAK